MDSLPRSFAEQPPQLWILNKIEQRVGDIPDISMSDPADALDTVLEKLKQIARAKELKRLASSRDPNVELSVIVWKPVNQNLKRRPT